MAKTVDYVREINRENKEEKEYWDYRRNLRESTWDEEEIDYTELVVEDVMIDGVPLNGDYIEGLLKE